MPLEGDLKSFNLPSILQLISQESLTGVLKIKRKSDVVDIGFSEGHITGAFFERGDSVDRLEDYLVKSGYIKQNLFEMIREIYQETKRPIMNIILEDKYLNVEDAQKVIKFKIQEVIDEVFTWQAGEFKFEQSAAIYPKSILKIRLTTESLVLEAARHQDEWPKIAKAIPSSDLVFKRIERPELRLKLADDEERVLTLVDGQRNVDDVVGMSGLGKFSTYSCLFRLLGTGQIEVAFAKPTPKKMKVRRKALAIPYKKILPPVLAAVVLLLLFIEYLIGNGVSRRITGPLRIIPSYQTNQDYADFKAIFYYRNNRLPSTAEVREIFNR